MIVNVRTRKHKHWTNDYYIHKSVFKMVITNHKDDFCHKYVFDIEDLDKVYEHIWMCKYSGSYVHSINNSLVMGRFLLGIGGNLRGIKVRHLDRDHYNFKKRNLKSNLQQKLSVVNSCTRERFGEKTINTVLDLGVERKRPMPKVNEKETIGYKRKQISSLLPTGREISTRYFLNIKNGDQKHSQEIKSVDELENIQNSLKLCPGIEVFITKSEQYQIV